MPIYEVRTEQKLKAVGQFETATMEEAVELFRQEHLKVNYSDNSLGWLSSGWNPEVKEIG
jgi:hypothetical protein